VPRESRSAPADLSPDLFRRLGHQLVDRVAEHLASVRSERVTPAPTPAEIRRQLPDAGRLPDAGADPGQLLETITDLLFSQSLFNGHPRFFGYITSSAAPLGMLGELLASGVNANVGAWKLSPVATEVEAQTIAWIADLVGFPAGCGGLLVSGGNMANFVGFLAARTRKAPWDVRQTGMRGSERPLRVYASSETHTWIQKAADFSGIGTDSICWVDTDRHQRLDVAALRDAVDRDRRDGCQPFMVVGTAGTVSTGAVDDLPEVAAVCREHDLWFHVDGAYGAFAAQSPGSPAALAAIADADSVALDPHKWLYAPLEAGCVLVRRPDDLTNTFSYHPSYYHFEEGVTNYVDYGLQNSRGFRALKVWLTLRQVGRAGYLQMIADDCALSRRLYQRVDAHDALEALTQSLSIATFRYVPPDLRLELPDSAVESYLDELNQDLLTAVEQSGELFLSNAIVAGKFALRACIVNFRTSNADVDAVPEVIARLGARIDRAIRPDRF
jgi:glutamate/tyrosine decarboxylase-like PLP-dependent enzyme